MPNSTVGACAGQDRANLYNEITDKIIAELEAGRVPWVQPWGTAAAKAPLAMPKNASTDRQYSGVNILILWGAVIERGFAGQSWLTFRQALSLGGHVRKGERGTTVVYADRFVPNDEKRRAAETGEDAQAIPFLKRFTVFNTDQCDDLPDGIATAAPPPPPGLIEPTVDALIKASGIPFRIGGDRAFYATAEDYVQVPPPQAYFEPINWHRTVLHELSLCRKSDYAAWPSLAAVTPALGHAAVRHNQSASRKASSSSLGRYRPGCISGLATCESAFSFSLMSAWI
ncbi:ArdC-like ssDNA-binding domain-containing protein [Bradyrhizobium huanghuaihaiense]|uniref:ArdC family protein n=1 Tax=Bradyrhizobium huanghuaihaiense TaxID=990078 RepID=UPI0021A9ED49|nr:ArdC-like ssDNA-binding domain-containing protein [Bradyrhizobium sp. CB3035]UWU76204.1 ArdC-like ssDNA-binding domain-containing protein [Bradyrhizobium sp. CB3035]